MNKTEITIIIFLFLAVLLTGFNNKKEIKLSEKDLLVFTERAYLVGYRTATTNQNRDTVWSNLANDYHNIFK